MKLKFTFLFLLVSSSFCFARTIILNINNNNSAGNLYSQNENVVIGDVIRFTNNLPYQITSNTNMSTRLVSNTGMNQVLTIAQGQFVEILIQNNTVSNYIFMHDNYQLNRYYNNRIELNFNLNSSTFFNDSTLFDFSFDKNSKNLSIKNNSINKTNLVIYDVKGEKVYSEENLIYDEKTLNLASLQAGIYILFMNSEERVKSVKFIVQ